jgi:hypothetical protein
MRRSQEVEGMQVRGKRQSEERGGRGKRGNAYSHLHISVHIPWSTFIE